MELVSTGDILQPDVVGRGELWPETLPPVYSLAIHADNRNDEVKLSSALQKLIDEDPSLSYEQVADTGELVIRGQGDVHLQIAIDRLVRLDYLLFEVVQGLPMPPDLESMRKFTTPENSAVRMASMLESVQSDYLRPAIQELWAVVQVSDVALRRELERRG